MTHRRRTIALATLPLAGALVLVTSLGADVRAQASAISAPAFLERIDRARAAAADGQRDPSPDAMDTVRIALGLPAAVRFGERVVTIARDPFLEGLDGSSPAEFSDATTHLDALARATERAAASPAIASASVRDALAEAYRDVPTPSVLSRYIEGAWNLVWTLLATWIDSLDGSNGIGSVLAWGAVLLAVAGLVAVLRRLGVGLVPERTASTARRATGVDWRAVAERAVATGDAATAVVALYHVLLEALAARGVITGDPALTAGECRAAVARSLPALYPSIASATESFERIAYGGRAPEPRDVDALRAANDAVRPR